MSEVGDLLGVQSALWWIEDGKRQLLAAYPLEGLDTEAVGRDLGGWSGPRSSPLNRRGSELAGAVTLTPESRWQQIWFLELDGPAQAIWAIESAQESAPETAAIAEILRLALQLRHLREQRAATHEAQLDELRSQRELMGHIVDALPVGLYVVDRDFRIVAWNRKRETGTQGVAREEAIGRSVFEVLYRQPREKLEAELTEVFESGEIQHYEVESTASGALRHYRLSKVPMRLLGGDEVTHVITIGEDITERKRISDSIAHAEKLAALGQMAAGVMHEINNPLATIAASAEALRDVFADQSEEMELISMVETEVDRCKRIALDLLAFSRPPPSEKGPVDVQEVVEETLRLLRHHDRFKKIQVQREYVYNLPLVSADAERLVQVFVVLALNALDAMEGDGELRVRTEAIDDDRVAVSFIDTGCGIPPSELPKIFEPFYTSKPPGKGTGLGLWICYGIVNEHGGQIEVDSTIGVGTNFRVVLPMHPVTGDHGEEIAVGTDTGDDGV